MNLFLLFYIFCFQLFTRRRSTGEELFSVFSFLRYICGSEKEPEVFPVLKCIKEVELANIR